MAERIHKSYLKCNKYSKTTPLGYLPGGVFSIIGRGGLNGV